MADLNVGVAASPLETALALTPARRAAQGRAETFAMSGPVLSVRKNPFLEGTPCDTPDEKAQANARGSREQRQEVHVHPLFRGPRRASERRRRASCNHRDARVGAIDAQTRIAVDCRNLPWWTRLFGTLIGASVDAGQHDAGRFCGIEMKRS